MRPFAPDAKALQIFSRRVGVHHPGPTTCHARRSRAWPRTSCASFATGGRRAEAMDRFRKLIWGEHPPGQADPYTPLSPEEKARELRRQEAAEKQKDVSTAPSTYEPAATWDGLEFVGEVDQASAEAEWSRRHPFRGFMATTRVTSPPHLVMAMHRAVVEVFTLQQAGEPLAKLSNPPDARDLTGAVQVSSSSAHGIHLRFPADDVRQDLLRILDQDLASPTEDVEEDAVGGHMEDEEASRMSSDESGDQAGMASDHVDLETETNAVTSRLDEGPSSSSTATTATTITEEDADRLKTQIATWSDDWLNIPLTDPTIKFAIVKRVMQLTGTRIPDPDIAQIDTVRALHGHVVRPPPPTKLAQALVLDDRLTSLPNVKIIPRRVTPIDRERELGRWKVIEKELMVRGLPVTGHA